MPEIMMPLKQITLLLVGPTGSGKTSFVRRILDQVGGYDKPEVYDGLHPCEYLVPGGEDNT